MAQALPFIMAAATVVGAGVSVASALSGPAQAKTTQPLLTPTRDDTQKIIDQQDALARRKGAAADILTGSSGAEAAPATTGRLVLGS